MAGRRDRVDESGENDCKRAVHDNQVSDLRAKRFINSDLSSHSNDVSSKNSILTISSLRTALPSPPHVVLQSQSAGFSQVARYA